MGTGVERPTTKAAVQHIFRTCAAVCFDVDSTAVVEEGIDVLAAHCGAGEVVAAWTAKAMGGSVPFDVALQERLKLIQPSAAALADVIASHPLTYSPGVQSLVAALKRDGKRVFLVSGGFRQMIEPVADGLGIAREDVVANRLFFNEGTSHRAARAQPLCRPAPRRAYSEPRRCRSPSPGACCVPRAAQTARLPASTATSRRLDRAARPSRSAGLRPRTASRPS